MRSGRTSADGMGCLGGALKGWGERLTSFGRLPRRVTTKHGTKEYHPRTFLEDPSRSRSRELYYPQGQSGTLRDHCAKRGMVFQVSNGIFVLRIHNAEGDIRESIHETSRRLALSTY